MPLPTLAKGTTGRLVFVAYQAGLDAALIASVSWQPQGGQQAVKFHPPDQVEGVAAGLGDYKVTVSLTTPGEKVTYAFSVQCVDPAAPDQSGVLAPVTIDTAPPVTP